MDRRWLGELRFAHPAQHLALEEMLLRIDRPEELFDRWLSMQHGLIGLVFNTVILAQPANIAAGVI